MGGIISADAAPPEPTSRPMDYSWTRQRALEVAMDLHRGMGASDADVVNTAKVFAAFIIGE